MDNRVDVLMVCEEYIHNVWCMEDMKEGGAVALYGLEQHRIELHEKLCDMLGLDHIKSKTILSYLDESIGLDLSKMPSDSDLRNYAEKLYELLTAKMDEIGKEN